MCKICKMHQKWKMCKIMGEKTKRNGGAAKAKVEESWKKELEREKTKDQQEREITFARLLQLLLLLLRLLQQLLLLLLLLLLPFLPSPLLQRT